MKKVGTYFLIGLAVAFAGVMFSVVFAEIFNGMPSGTGAVIGMCAYLCVVVITCTGIVVSKLERAVKQRSEEEKRS